MQITPIWLCGCCRAASLCLMAQFCGFSGTTEYEWRNLNRSKGEREHHTSLSSSFCLTRKFTHGIRQLRETPRPKRRKIEHVDRISDLPDEILVLILSLLSTREAVLTSLLAKGFRNLWASVPGLDFDFDEFILDGTTSEDLEDDEEKLSEYEEKFVTFVDGVLKHCKHLSFDRFKLVWNEENSDPLPATAWLDAVAKLKPKSLFVNLFAEKYDFEVPDSVFCCKSLEELVLQLGFETINPRSVNLPCLKVLIFDSVQIGDELMEKLSRLPAIEEMVLRYCQLNISDITSTTLKRLVLDGYYHDKTPPSISISTPNLLHLEVRSWAIGKIKFENLESLVNAHVHYQDFDDDQEPLFLTGLSKVTCLELMLGKWSLSKMKHALWLERYKFPTFKNLKTLKIGECRMTDDFDLVAYFLPCAPRLEKLHLLYQQSHAGGPRMEISLELGDIVEINGQKNGESVSELVARVHMRLKKILETNIVIVPAW